LLTISAHLLAHKLRQICFLKPLQLNEGDDMKLDGLYANIHAKRERIKAGSGETMRKPGTEGAPTAKAFKESAKTAKPEKKK
jgi:hypothetical protein